MSLRKTRIHTASKLLSLLLIIGVGTSYAHNLSNPPFTEIYASVQTSNSLQLIGQDFNEDGVPDVASLQTDNSVSLWLSDGFGSYSNPVTLATGEAPETMIAHDLDQDGHLDLIIANSGDNSLSVLYNNGGGSFTQTRSIALASAPSQLVVGDLISGGLEELLVAHPDDNDFSLIPVLDGRQFGSVSKIPAAIGINTLNVGDLDNNGRLDIVFTRETSSTQSKVHILVGDGQGGFTESQVTLESEYPRVIDLVQLADVDADSQLELVLVTNGMDVFLAHNQGIGPGYGSLSFDTRLVAIAGSFPRWGGARVLSMQVQDANNDDHLDLLMNPEFSSVGMQYQGSNLFPGDGHGGFAEKDRWYGNHYDPPVYEFDIFASPAPIRVDLDLDGQLDLITVDNSFDSPGVDGSKLSLQINPNDEAHSIIPASSDFDGDGTSDLLWRNAATGVTNLLKIQDNQIKQTKPVNTTEDLDWSIVGSGDFDGDNRSDILWRNARTGSNVIFLMDGNTILSTKQINEIADQNWFVAGVGDFDGDGKSDILWRNQATGKNTVFMMEGIQVKTARTIGTTPDLTWRVVGTGDFDSDGKADILWRNGTTGDNVLFYMDGTTVRSSGKLNRIADQNWQVAGIGDLDGDSHADILWQHMESGEVRVFKVNGFNIVGAKPIEGASDPLWKIVGIGDFNGDMRKDILWRHEGTGENMIYSSFISGVVGYPINTSGITINQIADQNWQVVGLNN